jgi:hypothetical protein
MNNEQFPEKFSISMAFMYKCHAVRTEYTETGVTYKCGEECKEFYDTDGIVTCRVYPCPFQVSIDPRDMLFQNVTALFDMHFNQSH